MSEVQPKPHVRQGLRRRTWLAAATVAAVSTASLLAVKAAVAGLSVPGGVKNALTAKLDQATKLLAKGDTTRAVSLLSTDFIGQVTNLLSEGKLTAAQAAALTLAAEEAILNITS